VAFDPLHEVKEFTDQFTISKLWGPHAFTAGAFYTHADIHREQSGGGLGISPVMNRPYLFDIELERPGGELVQITSPEGFAAIGDTSGGGTSNDGDKDQFSIFFGHSWDIAEKLHLDWGLRYENIHYKVTNQTVAAPANFGDPTEGGADGDPLTYWDNFPNVLATTFDTERNYDYFSYSTSLGYELTDDLQTYVRFSSGKKAPDFQTLLDIDSQAEVDNLFVEPQKIQQVEVGVKYSSDNIHLAVFPFWSELSNVASNQLFTDQNGQIYSPTPTTATLTTFGVEIEADYQITEALNLSTSLTIQNSESKDFAIWVANTPSRDDDVLVATPDGDADNIPHVMARTTLAYAPTDWASAFVTWNYLGDRPANRYNAFDLPAFSIFDLGVYFQLTDSLQLRADVKNVLNETEGVLSWAPSGGFFAALDRQAFTPAQLAANPDQFFSIVTAPPRAYFLTLDLTF
jgi:outer membrane receptor protein involved in Fe transport